MEENKLPKPKAEGGGLAALLHSLQRWLQHYTSSQRIQRGLPDAVSSSQLVEELCSLQGSMRELVPLSNQKYVVAIFEHLNDINNTPRNDNGGYAIIAKAFECVIAYVSYLCGVLHTHEAPGSVFSPKGK